MASGLESCEERWRGRQQHTINDNAYVVTDIHFFLLNRQCLLQLSNSSNSARQIAHHQDGENVFFIGAPFPLL